MSKRPLHAVLISGPDGARRLIEPLRLALDGAGPAIVPLDAEDPRIGALIDDFAPDAVIDPEGSTISRSGGHGTDEGTALIIATSGSTGEPKGVELPAAALLHSARASLRRIGAAAGERWLCCLPVTHIAGIQVLVRSLLSGAAPVISPAADHAPVAHVSLVPTQLRRLLAAGTPPSRAAGFKSVLIGGAAAPESLIERAKAADVPVVTTYGMTETCGGCVYDGRPLDGVTVTAGDDGRLRVAGPVLFSGYRGRPEESAAAFENEAFVTSDLGNVKGSMVTVRGRADDVINTGGHKVVAGEVAQVLESCQGVRQAVVLGYPDPEWGERVIAVIVPDDLADPPGINFLRTRVRERLPRYASPSEVVLAEAIPMLSSGKPDLARLRREHSPARSVNL